MENSNRVFECSCKGWAEGNIIWLCAIFSLAFALAQLCFVKPRLVSLAKLCWCWEEASCHVPVFTLSQALVLGVRLPYTLHTRLCAPPEWGETGARKLAFGLWNFAGAGVLSTCGAGVFWTPLQLDAWALVQLCWRWSFEQLAELAGTSDEPSCIDDQYWFKLVPTMLCKILRILYCTWRAAWTASMSCFSLNLSWGFSVSNS